jgi:hypothetical protein
MLLELLHNIAFIPLIFTKITATKQDYVNVFYTKFYKQKIHPVIIKLARIEIYLRSQSVTVTKTIFLKLMKIRDFCKQRPWHISQNSDEWFSRLLYATEGRTDGHGLSKKKASFISLRTDNLITPTWPLTLASYMSLTSYTRHTDVKRHLAWFGHFHFSTRAFSESAGIVSKSAGIVSDSAGYQCPHHSTHWGRVPRGSMTQQTQPTITITYSWHHHVEPKTNWPPPRALIRPPFQDTPLR